MAANKAKSKIRGMCLALSTGLVRTIGIARAKAKIGLIKLVFNIRRLVTLEKWPPPGRRTSTKPEKIVAKLRQVDVLVDRRDRGRASVKFTDGSSHRHHRQSAKAPPDPLRHHHHGYSSRRSRSLRQSGAWPIARQPLNCAVQHRNRGLPVPCVFPP